MDLVTVFQKFPTQESCIEHLEIVRWASTPQCPHCGSDHVARKVENQRIGRWNCHGCKNSFNVLSGTIFQGTKIPLQKWFLAISLLLNAKKSLSSHQLGRDLDVNQRSAWYLAMRIRDAMVDKDAFLMGIVEADETYVGGKPRKSDRNSDDPPKRGRGTKKLPIIGAVARKGRVVAEPSPKVTAKTLKAFLTRHVKADESVLVTDEFSAYSRMGEWVPHETINHTLKYVEGLIHTNTIEGFWALVKRAIFGQHNHYTHEHAAAYIIEACFKYNTREDANPFDSFIQAAVTP